MSLELQIHHIDVDQGESTLIVVRHMPEDWQQTMLIDGGLYGMGDVVHEYLVEQKITKVNVMVATHYDKDHYGGLRKLLEMPSTKSNGMYEETVVFDQGEQGNIDQFGKITNRETDFLSYLKAVGARNRPTGDVASADCKSHDWKSPKWLVGEELLWRKSDGEPRDTIPSHYPRVTCIAANQYVRSIGSSETKWVFGVSADPRNQKSLALLVEFNNFRYFTGGDLEATQEDELIPFLLKKGVSAMKAGHHGSHLSTSKKFLAGLAPKAVFISCGAANSFGHPTQDVIDRLQDSTSVQNYYMTACGDERKHVPASQDLSQLGAKARVAGNSSIVNSGHIKLTVTKRQSRSSPACFNVTYWEDDGGGEITILHD